MKPSNMQIHPEAGANIPLATKAKQVEAWLSSLPHDDPLVSARLLAGYLVRHDRAEIAAGFRKQLLDAVSVEFRRILNTLEAAFRDLPLPMDVGQLDRADHALRLLAAASDFNKRLIAECAERSAPLFGANPLPGHLGRFLHLQREIMDLCHLSHRQLPDAFWLGSHRAGLILFRFGLVGTLDASHPATTLGELYLPILLEATADPYHFSEQERLWTLDVIGRYGSLAVVELARNATRGGVFGIRVGDDKPPYPLSWQSDMQPDCDLVLNTAPLVRELALIISRMGADGGGDRTPPDARLPGYKALLQRLKLIWGGSAQRASVRRRPARPSLRTAVVGFHTVYRYLADPAGQLDEDAAIQCQLVNESLGGVALMVAEQDSRLKIGSLVCVSRGQGGAWNDLGLVRWFKTGGNGVLTFGVKYLRGKMRPSVWSPPGDGHAYPCLLAEAERGGARIARNLIVLSSRIGSQTRLAMRQGNERFVVDLAGKVEALPEIDIFRCESVATDA